MDITTINFNDAELDEVIAESGLCDEFVLDADVRRSLASAGVGICALALAAKTDAAFDAGLAAIAAPESDDELAFLMGLMYHVREELLSAFAPVEAPLELRQTMHARIERVREMCAAAG